MIVNTPEVFDRLKGYHRHKRLLKDVLSLTPTTFLIGALQEPENVPVLERMLASKVLRLIY